MSVRKYSLAAALLGAILMIGWAAFLFGGGLDGLADAQVQHVSDKVATQTLDQYHIAQRAGTPMDVCVQAALVSAAYLQAKDEANFTTAKAREKDDCARAGAPGL